MQSRTILAVIIVIIVFTGVYVFLQRKNSKKNAEQTSENIYAEQVNIKLREIEKKFINEAVGFYIQEKTFELNMNKKDKEELYEKTGYKEVYSSPVIDWSTEFDFMKENTDKRDNAIKEYLSSQTKIDFCEKHEFILNCFERYLLLEAKKTTNQLIK